MNIWKTYNESVKIMTRVFFAVMGFLTALIIYSFVFVQPVKINNDYGYYQPLTLHGTYKITELEF